MFRTDSGELLKLSVAVVITVTAARYVWSRFLRRESRPASNSSTKKPTASEAQVDTSPECGVWIYFGSQSGTAEGFAKELEQEAAEHELTANVVDLEEFNPEDFVKHKVVILVVATYGEGDPTDNSVEFFKWLQDDSLPADTLQGLRYTVMGLGNRQYVNFNACGRIADEKMKRLGATCIYDRGEGDDDQNIEDDFEQWRTNGLWSALRVGVGIAASPTEASGDSGGLETPEVVLARLPLRVELVSNGTAPPVDPLVQVGGADVLGKWYFNSVQVPVAVCDQLRQVVDLEAGKTTKHIELDVKSFPGLEWRTADNLEVLPENPESTVEWFAARLGVKDQLQEKVCFARAAGVTKAVKKPFPSPCSLRVALSLYCDLNSAPSRSVAKRFAAFATDASERALLERLLQDKDAYQWLTGDGVRLTLREFFELFLPSARMDVGAFLQLCPRQKSRPYTISSSSREDPHRIGICVSMVQEQLAGPANVLEGLEARGYAARGLNSQSRLFKGLCSTMLCTQTSVGDKLWVTARASSFRLPRKASTPIIMVGAGTGVAPFRGFLREFRSEKGIRENTLFFFGCTKQDEDFLYREELREAVKLEPPALRELVTAFSREQQQKVYVQHRLSERAEELAQLHSKGAYVYVCGGVSMGKSVREEFARALGSADIVTRLQTEGKYIEELW